MSQQVHKEIIRPLEETKTILRDLTDLAPLLIREPFCPMGLSGLVSVAFWQVNFMMSHFKSVSAGLLDSVNLKNLELVVRFLLCFFFCIDFTILLSLSDSFFSSFSGCKS